uniref:Maturase K n=1 Tax=Haplomitrium blumei TaxID=258993 RepID=A0A4Y5P7T5_9MARC|nr:maturase K [Haplomitrium blumei]QCW59389.1 maturase K [Haplomitrium blumei]
MSGSMNNFFAMKRATREIRGNVSSPIYANEMDPDTGYNSAGDTVSKKIREAFAIIFDTLFPIHSKGLEPLLGKRNDWNSSLSIQSVFPFMEDNSLHPNGLSLLDIATPHYIHPEILVRIFRRQARDVPFLHALRLLLHGSNIIMAPDSIISLSIKEKKLSVFFWNFMAKEFESFLNDSRNHFYKFRSIPYLCLLDQNQSVRKLQHVSDPDIFVGKKIVVRNVSINYVRFRNDSFVTTDGTNWFTKRWKYLFLRLWHRYLHLNLRPRRISLKKLLGNSFPFLGYDLGNGIARIIVQVKFVNYFTITNLSMRRFSGTIPISRSIKSLAKENYCDTSGHPICKLSWTVLSDDEISKRFHNISKSICRYYNGCCNKKGLYQIQYILRFPRAKTLACKHKGTIRSVWKRYGSNLFTYSIPSKEVDSLASNFWRRYPDGSKFWYFDIIEMNRLAISLHKTRTKRIAKHLWGRCRQYMKKAVCDENRKYGLGRDV